MTAPSGSLEDCQTNVFSLTELSGLKWKCYASKAEHNNTNDIEQDPVLRAYGQCLSDGVLCTWRRTPQPSATAEVPTLRLDCQKELWIFWYSTEEPKIVNVLRTATDLTVTVNKEADDPNASTEDPNGTSGVSYEVRVLFFKSLHTVIERNLARSGYIRFGGWFTRLLDSPLSDLDASTPQYVIGFKLNFFVHGDNHVCMTVNVQRQPPVYRLSPAFLKSKVRRPVILGPWSMRAFLLPNQPLSNSSSRDNNATGATFSSSNFAPAAANNFPPPANIFGSSSSLNDIQAAVTQQWNVWKKFLVLPSDSSEESVGMKNGEKQRETLPKMVLVEVDDVLMFYPSCFVGVIPEEEPSGDCGEDLSAKCESNDSFGDNLSDGLRAKGNAKENTPTALGHLRHSRRSHVGIRAGRRTIEDGYFSVLSSPLSSANARRHDCTPGDLGHVGLPPAPSDEEGRFKFYDYLQIRSKICYCGCQNGHVPANDEPSTSSRILEERVFHRNFADEAASFPCDREQAFQDELNALEERSKENDTPIWSRGVSRKAYVSGKLELDNGAESDVTKTFCNFKNCFEPMTHNLSPFTPITCITPEPGDNTDCPSPGSKDRLKTFAYTYHPLQRDTIPAEPYHLYASRENKPLGVPADRPFAGLSKQPNGNPQGSQVATTSQFADSSILKSLLDSDDSNTLETSAKEETSDRITCPVAKRRIRIKSRLRRNTNPLSQQRKQVKWPSIALLDGVHLAVEDNEESSPFVVTNELNAAFSVNAAEVEETNTGLQNTTSLMCNSKNDEKPNSAVEADEMNDRPSTSRHLQEILDEPMDVEEASSSTAVTPPALCNLEESSELRQLLADDSSRSYNAENSNDDMRMSKMATSSNSYNQAMTPTDPSMHPSTSQVPSVGSDNMHILSPPASNERADPLASLFPTLSQSQGSSHQSVTSGLVSASSHICASQDLSSLNVIYPTPPTPMQQFSPQNAMICAQVIAEVQYQQQSTKSTGIKDMHDNTETGGWFQELDKNLNGEHKALEFPKSECFTGDLLSEEVDLEKRLSFCYVSSAEQQQSLKVALKTRRRRTAITAAPNYKSSSTSNGHNGHSHSQKFKLLNGRMYGSVGIGSPYGPSDITLSSHGQGLTNGSNTPSSMPPPLGPGALPAFPAPMHTTHAAQMAQQRMHQMAMRPQLRPGMMPTQQQLLQQSMMANGAYNGNGLMNGSLNSPQMMGTPPFRPPYDPAQLMNRPDQLALARQGHNMPPHQMTDRFGNVPSNSHSGALGINSPSVGGMLMGPGGMPNQSSTYSQFAPPAQPAYGSGNLHERQVPSSSLARMPSASSLNANNGLSVNNAANRSVDDAGFALKLLRYAKPVTLAVLLQDSVLDLHYDVIFDACPICACNGNIRARELGMYIRAPDEYRVADEVHSRHSQNKNYYPDFWNGFTEQSGAISCKCGFSAIRHRYLSGINSGLFNDDIKEGANVKPNYLQPKITRTLWFTASSSSDLEFVNLLRQQCLTRDICSVIENAYYLSDAVLQRSDRVGTETVRDADYIISPVDAIEVNTAISNAIDQVVPAKDSARLTKKEHKDVLHPWGVQVANAVREPREPEHMAILQEVRPLLEDTLRKIRGAQNSGNIVEGPLSWRFFHRKTLKTLNQSEEEGYEPQRIPQVIVSTEREAVALNPQLLPMWERLSLGPYDQPKDVLYLAVVPDANVVVEKCKIFLEELSSVYEKCRFGRHVKVITKDSPRDGIFRVDHKNVTNSGLNLGFLDNFDGKHTDDRKLLMSRLKHFTENYANELTRFFKNNDAIFERRGYYETLYRDSLQQNYTSLATATDTHSMPPPAVPIQSPSSVLSSASGPASTNFLQPAGAQLSSPSAQQSPAINTAPASVPTASGIEALTPDSQTGGTPNPHPIPPVEGAIPKAVVDDATVEKVVDELMSEDNTAALPHVIVIYLVNPFSFGSDAHHALFARLATVALMRTFNTFLYQMDSQRRPQIQLEMLNMQTLYDHSAFASDPLREDRQRVEPTDYSATDKLSSHECVRRTAFAVYNQTRLLLSDSVKGVLAKSMTRFGPASSMSDLLDNIKSKQTVTYFKAPSNPFVLAPTRSIAISATAKDNKLQLINQDDRVLFLSYCLIGEDWLCAAATDEKGHLLDTTLINMVVPNDTRKGSVWKYKNRSQIFDTIYRLWQYVQSLVVLDSKNWRVVVGRLGKIGHGEFKAWTQIMSKQSLRAFNNSLKGKDQGHHGPGSTQRGCRTCSFMPGSQEIPVILSACLVNTEAEPNLRIFTSYSSQTDVSKNGKLKVQSGIAEDPSVTHIMVFPTRSDTGHQGAQEEEQDDFAFGDNFGIPDEQDDSLIEDVDFTIFGGIDNPIDYQPLASGFFISTAPATDLPDWFWSPYPAGKHRLPVHLKSSLYLNCQGEQDDSISKNSANHPLEASTTDEVLKYVLETYNALSWLSVDMLTGARHSCLPVHMQALLRLYRSVKNIFSS